MGSTADERSLTCDVVQCTLLLELAVLTVAAQLLRSAETWSGGAEERQHKQQQQHEQHEQHLVRSCRTRVPNSAPFRSWG